MKKKLLCHLSEEQYERLRKTAFDSRRSMSEILREGLDLVLEKIEKKVDEAQ